MSFDPVLLEMVGNDAESNLGLVLDLFDLSRHYSHDSRIINRFTRSSIIHAFISLEGAINRLGFELFRYESSFRFIPQVERDIPLLRFINAWDKGLSLNEKFTFLTSRTKIEVPSRLSSQLIELINLRNMLIHGRCIITTLLLDPIRLEDSSFPQVEGHVPPGSYNEIDREYSINWQRQFPNTNFGPIDELGRSSAKLAIEIVIDCLELLGRGYHQPYAIVSCIDKQRGVLVILDKVDKKLLKLG